MFSPFLVQISFKITILKEVEGGPFEVMGNEGKRLGTTILIVCMKDLCTMPLRQQSHLNKYHLMLLQWLVCTQLHLFQTHPVWPTAPLRSPGENLNTTDYEDQLR